MNCNLTDKERDNGHRCRSFNCRSCADHGISANDATIINIHMENMMLKKELEEKQKEVELNEKALKLVNSLFKIVENNQKKQLEEKQKVIDELTEIVGMADHEATLYERSEKENGGVFTPNIWVVKLREFLKRNK